MCGSGKHTRASRYSFYSARSFVHANIPRAEWLSLPVWWEQGCAGMWHTLSAPWPTYWPIACPPVKLCSSVGLNATSPRSVFFAAVRGGVAARGVGRQGTNILRIPIRDKIRPRFIGIIIPAHRAFVPGCEGPSIAVLCSIASRVL